MARVGWVAAQQDTDGAASRWVRLSVFDDGWVEVPTFGRGAAALRGNLRTALLNFGGLVVGLAVVWAALFIAGRIEGVGAGVLRLFAVLLLIGVFGTLLVRSFRQSSRQRARRAADSQDLRRLKQSGGLPGHAPGMPLWRRARTAEQFSSWLTNTTLVRATDVSTVTIVPSPVAADRADGSEVAVDVLLHSGAVRRYRSPDATLGTLLTPFAGHP